VTENGNHLLTDLADPRPGPGLDDAWSEGGSTAHAESHRNGLVSPVHGLDALQHAGERDPSRARPGKVLDVADDRGMVASRATLNPTCISHFWLPRKRSTHHQAVRPLPPRTARKQDERGGDGDDRGIAPGSHIRP
jgi:hypothetical protein